MYVNQLKNLELFSLFMKVSYLFLNIMFPRGYDSVMRRMQSWVCLLYNLYNTHEFILCMTWCHTKNELVGVV